MYEMIIIGLCVERKKKHYIDSRCVGHIRKYKKYQQKLVDISKGQEISVNVKRY